MVKYKSFIYYKIDYSFLFIGKTIKTDWYSVICGNLQLISIKIKNNFVLLQFLFRYYNYLTNSHVSTIRSRVLLLVKIM